jgi:uncharacterized protein DUF3618
MSDDTAAREEALADEIEQTRQQLGETVEALAAKTDVKGRAKRRAAEIASTMRSKAGTPEAKTAAQVAAAVAALVLAWLALRRPRR